MNLKNRESLIRPPSSYEISFGIDGLNSPSLIQSYYPDDLPKDWRLSYYSNEFKLLLIGLDELNVTSPLSSDMGSQEMEAISPEIIIKRLNAMSDDLEEDVFLFFDLSKLPQYIQKRVVLLQTEADNRFHVINRNKINQVIQLNHTTKVDCLVYKPLSPDVESHKDDLICIVSCAQTVEQPMEAIELRKLIEQVREFMTSCDHESAKIFFSSAHHALKNCRNAILLEFMM